MSIFSAVVERFLKFPKAAETTSKLTQGTPLAQLRPDGVSGMIRRAQPPTAHEAGLMEHAFGEQQKNSRRPRAAR
jgi:hypothetical protein